MQNKCLFNLAKPLVLRIVYHESVRDKNSILIYKKNNDTNNCIHKNVALSPFLLYMRIHLTFSKI